MVVIKILTLLTIVLASDEEPTEIDAILNRYRYATCEPDMD